MSRFMLGVLVGALAMYWYTIHGDAAVRDLAGWFQDTARDYRPPPR